MENEMSCPDPIQFDPVLGFKCIARLSGISASGTDYYVRCKDNPDLNEGDMNVMAESYEYSLKQSNALKMKNLQPNGTIFGTVESYPITLSAETFVGEEKGKAICQYKLSSESIFRNFDETDGIIHSQVLQPGSGDYAYDVKCYDIAGNVVTGVIDFELEIDTDSPIVARAYEEGKKLKIVTVNEASCSYSFSDCDFEFDDGISMASSNGGESHLADWKQDKTYYVKCADDFRGTPSDCSIIVRPSSV